MSEVSRPARLVHLRALLAEEKYTSQQELSEALLAHDVRVSQSTLSKDLVALGAVRRRSDDGALVYALAPDGDTRAAALDKLARTCSEMLLQAHHAANQIVGKTFPGAAQYFAACLDGAKLSGVLGSIAGDDTVLIIASDEVTASKLLAYLSEMTRTGRAPVEST